MMKSGRRKSILVVEDEPALRQLYLNVLTADGFVVDTAANGNASWNAWYCSIAATITSIPPPVNFSSAWRTNRLPTPSTIVTRIAMTARTTRISTSEKPDCLRNRPMTSHFLRLRFTAAAPARSPPCHTGLCGALFLLLEVGDIVRRTVQTGIIGCFNLPKNGTLFGCKIFFR